MSLIKNNALVGASGQGGYFIDRSLRFRSSASAYLSWTPASAGNRKTWTWSGWVKRGALSVLQEIFEASDGTGNNETVVQLNANNTLTIYSYIGAYQLSLVTTQVFRDSSAWFHLVLSVDTTQATSSDRAKLYINGTQVTAFATATYPTQNYDTYVNTTQVHSIGRMRTVSGRYFDGYMTEINFVDGQALDPTSFGEYNSDTGVWQPKKYGGTYGTNGFYLNFSDNSTTTTLGYDTSGNSNNWTANNISVTSGATYDSMTDVPTLTSTDAANYATLNPLAMTGTYSNGNLNFTTAAADSTLISTIAVSSGKWYCEFSPTAITANCLIGIVAATSRNGFAPTNSNQHPSIVYVASTGNKFINGTGTSYGATYTTNDVIGIALDLDNLTIEFYKNGSAQGSITGVTSSTYCFAVGDGDSVYTWSGWANFGQRPFAHTPPAGFKSLNTYNLPDSTIVDGSQYFNAVTYTGNTSGASVTGVGFQPDFVWVKNRSVANNHELIDAVRGGSSALFSNLTNAEATQQRISSFDSDGWTYTTNSNSASANPYVGWTWKESATAGFDIVTFTNTASSASFNHSLGVTPSMIILKGRGPTAANWTVFHKSLANMTSAFLGLNTTNGVGTLGTAVPAPTSTTFGSSSAAIPASESSVAYLFADVDGFSKFGFYTGNGSTDGPFVYTGFRPAFVMFKRTNSTGNWQMWELNPVGTYNVVNNLLYANLINAETSASATGDALSNGFKLRQPDNDNNASGGTYIYMAFAENPFKNSLAR